MPQWSDAEPIGRLVERVRADQGKSQHVLAELLAEASGNPSITREYVSRWENGKRIPPPTGVAIWPRCSASRATSSTGLRPWLMRTGPP
jgi:Helix-turn-helix